LLEVSEKARKKAEDGEEGYARVTAWNVARDVERGAGTWSPRVIKIDAGDG
jgi:hypothetical protein